VYQWLDTVSDSFVAPMAPPINLSREEQESNRIIILCMQYGETSPSFKEAITDIALGDVLYKSIIYASQYESLDSDDASIDRKRMSNVDVYFDTGIIFRLFGYFGVERQVAAQEL